MSPRRLLSAVVAALISVTSIGAVEAQLWKPKKKAAVSAKKKPVARKAARKKPVAKKKKPASSSVVKFGPPPNRDDDDAPDSLVDDNPRITVYDGDRDE